MDIRIGIHPFNEYPHGYVSLLMGIYRDICITWISTWVVVDIILHGFAFA